MTQLNPNVRAPECVPAQSEIPKNAISAGDRRSYKWWQAILPLFLLSLICLVTPSGARAQTTATLSGTVQDPSGGVIPGAQVTLTNDATHDKRAVMSNASGLYAFPSLVPGSYSLVAAAKGFQAAQITGIDLHAGDTRTVPALALTVGSESQTITVQADEVMIPEVNGERSDVLDAKQIENLSLEGRDTTELLKVLTGATTVSGGLTQNSPMYNDLNITVQQSAIGNGININGAVNRGGTGSSC